MKKQIIIVLLGVHLIFVYMATCLFDISRLPNRMQRSLGLYFACVGASGYGFFAVPITSEPVAKCYILDADNKMKEEPYGVEQGSYEFKEDCPLGLLYDQRAHEVAARIIAHHCFITYPHARVVRVCLGLYTVPSIHDYTRGKQCFFSQYYSATYLNN